MIYIQLLWVNKIDYMAETITKLSEIAILLNSLVIKDYGKEGRVDIRQVV